MKRSARLLTLVVLAASLHGCSLWYFDHDYDAAQHSAQLTEKATKERTLAAL
ncbi:hypothetical protein LX59_00776 [Azomonas agilis]|uniref:Uncharacterized protein n=1 Tax=Azomonas agilis TaxID=116849 RepID=A0A562J0B0_9GAMM|nr:hypothetical protein [Azomonas agilis]TWH76731.1 hypothetical protein LX59_00776 [Azomonas agilis]